MRVLVVCGAGASSTFLVHWMRKVATSRALELDIAAGSQSTIAASLGDVDLLLVGGHLEDAYPRLEAEAAAAGVPSALLPPVEFTAAGAAVILDLVESLTAASAAASVSEPTGSRKPGSPHA